MYLAAAAGLWDHFNQHGVENGIREEIDQQLEAKYSNWNDEEVALQDYEIERDELDEAIVTINDDLRES
jgi:hypothetical protein